MIRGSIAVIAIGLVGLFGYYFVSDSSERAPADKARDAALQVGDAVVESSVGGLVEMRLAAELGLERGRFLHAHVKDGTALVYGLAPAEVTAERIQAIAVGVPGVKQAVVQVQPLPDLAVLMAPAAEGAAPGGGAGGG